MKASEGRKLPPVEATTIRSFFVRERRDQFLRRLADPGTRGQMLDKFNHVDLLDRRYACRIAPQDQSADSIHQRLVQKGAPPRCFVLGPHELDGRDVALADALRAVVPYSQGTLISCIPGKLGYFQGEERNERYILER